MDAQWSHKHSEGLFQPTDHSFVFYRSEAPQVSTHTIAWSSSSGYHESSASRPWQWQRGLWWCSVTPLWLSSSLHGNFSFVPNISKNKRLSRRDNFLRFWHFQIKTLRQEFLTSRLESGFHDRYTRSMYPKPLLCFQMHTIYRNIQSILFDFLKVSMPIIFF